MLTNSSRCGPKSPTDDEDDDEETSLDFSHPSLAAAETFIRALVTTWLDNYNGAAPACPELLQASTRH